jgi:hypothetical protein
MKERKEIASCLPFLRLTATPEDYNELRGKKDGTRTNK